MRVRGVEDRVDEPGREQVGDHDLLDQAAADQEERPGGLDLARDRAGCSCGRNSLARTIGPATRCGKKDW